MKKFGKLTLGAVPIGDFNDASINLIKYIIEHNFILVENIDIFNTLCKNLNIKTNATVINYGNDDVYEELDAYIQILKNGNDILFLSDEGTAGLIDPGGMLLQVARENNIEVKVMPGPNAIIPSIILARFSDSFYFYGLTPDKKERREAFSELCNYIFPTVFFVTREYLEDFTLDAIEYFGPERKVFVCSNLTKENEFVEFNTLQDMYNQLHSNKINFSITLVIAGKN